ncbi:fatty acyl-CoA reductase 2 [Sorex araneus]|uniref:fatty acyl-CoA reductase 2 n=1 Tax=Sorex araneus TaxID=42254 RepID=UPI0024334783|nr:fatty acyl-CoA reductase 2 [Sorex araneus]
MSEIAPFYEGKSVLVTGATGFLGKVLLEKLLRASPGLRVVYVLVRPKKGQTLQERVAQMLSYELFDKVKELYPNVHEKIRPICADLNQQDLAISKEDTQELLSSTNLVFHCAATVRFDDHLKHAVQLNVAATQQLLRMASQMARLEAFVHVSTAYANCNLQHIDEVVYSCPVEPQQIMASMEWLDDAIIEEITPRLIGDRPNTYIYTKALAEMVVQKEGGHLNMAIVRPSIVGATWQEPFPGWVDNFNGITGIITAMGKGLLRSMKGTPRAVADIIPVDIVANLILAVGWYTAVHRPKSTRIYHCTSGALNPCCWRDIAALMVASFEKVPLEQTFWRPNAELYSSALAKKYWNMVSHWCPVVICDLYLRLTGRKPRFMKVMSRIQKMLSLLEYFVSHSWEWSVNSSEMLRAQLSPEDQRVFNFDVRQLNWLEYIENYVVGVKKHLLKEEMSGVPKAKEHLKKLRNIQYLFNTALVLLAWHLLVTRSQVMRNIWFFLVNSCSKLLPCLRAPRVSRV